MQTRDEVEGLHNCREFSQALECLYQDMQTQEKSYKITFPGKKSKTLLFRALIEREILTSREVLYTKLVRVISLCFAKKMLSSIRVFSLKMSVQARKNWHSMFLTIFQVSTDEEMGQ